MEVSIIQKILIETKNRPFDPLWLTLSLPVAIFRDVF